MARLVVSEAATADILGIQLYGILTFGLQAADRYSAGLKAAMARLNKAAVENVVFAPTGFYLGYQAWRKNVTGVVSGPLPFFWDVKKG